MLFGVTCLVNKSLDTLSRLKGIETLGRYSQVLCELSLDTLSRLKGIETIIPHP